AKNREGVKELNDFLSEHNIEKKDLPDTAPTFINTFIVYPFNPEIQLKENEFLGIRFDELHLLYSKDLKEIRHKLVALQPVFVADKVEYRLHEYLRAIDLNCVLTKVGDADRCSPTDMFLSAGEMEAKYSKYA